MLDQTAHNPIPSVYAAIELSKKSWVIAIMQPAKDQPSVYRIDRDFAARLPRSRAKTSASNLGGYLEQLAFELAGRAADARHI